MDSSSMSAVRISIILVFVVSMMGSISGRNHDDPYKMGGTWYVVAAMNLRTNKLNPKCWRIEITAKSRTELSGIAIYQDKRTNRPKDVHFNVSRATDFLYPNIFDVSLRGNEIVEPELKIALYPIYIYNYTILEWEEGVTNKRFDSLVLSRQPEFSRSEIQSITTLYPKVFPISNDAVTCKSMPRKKFERQNQLPTSDPFQLNGTWYIGAYQSNRTFLKEMRCWIVRIRMTELGVYRITSSFISRGKNVSQKFDAKQFSNWTHVPKFQVYIRGSRSYIPMIPFRSHIYNYSYWVVYAQPAPFEYLVASRYPAFTEEETNSLDFGSSSLYTINNTRYDGCPSLDMNTVTIRESTNEEETDDYIIEAEPDTDLDSFVEDPDDSSADHPVIEISFLPLFVILFVGFLIPLQ